MTKNELPSTARSGSCQRIRGTRTAVAASERITPICSSNAVSGKTWWPVGSSRTAMPKTRSPSRTSNRRVSFEKPENCGPGSSVTWTSAEASLCCSQSVSAARVCAGSREVGTAIPLGDDRLQLDVPADALLAELATHAGCLEAAERRDEVHGVLVDPE